MDVNPLAAFRQYSAENVINKGTSFLVIDGHQAKVVPKAPGFWDNSALSHSLTHINDFVINNILTQDITNVEDINHVINTMKHLVDREKSKWSSSFFDGAITQAKEIIRILENDKTAILSKAKKNEQLANDPLHTTYGHDDRIIKKYPNANEQLAMHYLADTGAVSFYVRNDSQLCVLAKNKHNGAVEEVPIKSKSEAQKDLANGADFVYFVENNKIGYLFQDDNFKTYERVLEPDQIKAFMANPMADLAKLVNPK